MSKNRSYNWWILSIEYNNIANISVELFNNLMQIITIDVYFLFLYYFILHLHSITICPSIYKLEDISDNRALNYK